MNRKAIFLALSALLFWLIGNVSYAQKVNHKGEYVVKRIDVEYPNQSNDNYSILFFYNEDFSLNKMEHYHLWTKDLYEFGFDSQGLKEVKYHEFQYVRKGMKLYQNVKPKEKHYSFNKMGLLFKKIMYLNNAREIVQYTFLYDKAGRHMTRFEKVVASKKFKEDNSTRIGIMTWNPERHYLMSYNCKVYLENDNLTFNSGESFVYYKRENNSNIDFNWLFFMGDLKTNIEGCIGFYGMKMPYLMAYEKNRNEMFGSHLEYEYDSFGRVIQAKYKMQKLVPVEGEHRNVKEWFDFFVMKVQYY